MSYWVWKKDTTFALLDHNSLYQDGYCREVEHNLSTLVVDNPLK